MGKLTFRLWLLIIVLILSLIAISPSLESGVVIRSVDVNSSAYDAGIRGGEVIQGINGQEVSDIDDYGRIINEILSTGETVGKVEVVGDGEIDTTDIEKIKITISTKDTDYILFTNEAPKITVKDIPSSRIKTGLDLQGGARALVKPEVEISMAQMNDLIEITRNRLNVFGLSDLSVRSVSDLEGNNFMVVEIAGATPNDLKDLIGKQGKFEAKVGNESVFTGGKDDISDVCRNDATCAGIRNCGQTGEGSWSCQFAFVLYLTEEAAQKHADVTRNISIDEAGEYLTEKLYLFIDDVEVDSLFVGADLKGKVTTQISIQGPGSGSNEEEAFNNAKRNMNKLQTILLTGSLPYKLEIVKLDTISPSLGEKFVNNLLLAGAAAILVVSLIVFLRYRNFKISLAVLFTAFSEIFIILGFASLMNWNLDLPSIAGILIAIGTGVDQQIIIVDESKRKEEMSLVQKLKRALFIITGAYFTSVVSLIPLWWVGAGLLRGFVFTTIAGITIGVLITRPAFADIIKKIEK
ncbi:MAG: MMPL family transporter [Nanoarchaeota archaeon]|nr:MMPL family transporter [Nanoarchaeota archaeon]